MIGATMSESALKLIVGLGNPGPEYARTRHNAGFWFVDALAAQHGGTWRRRPREQAELARARIGETELWLAKPTNYMNLSGMAVAAIANFYRIKPAELLIVHDDIDLPPGVARLKQGGGHGGHNGVRDVIAQLGADFWRLRLGVGHPGHRDAVIDAVLDRPTAAEQTLIDEALGRALEVMPLFLGAGAQKAMHALHSRNPGGGNGGGNGGGSGVGGGDAAEKSTRTKS
jgi:PTH1 family peptidyl-tRNA hydrolase